MIILYFTFFLQILFYQDFLSHYVFLSNPNFSFSILHPFFNYLTLTALFYSPSILHLSNPNFSFSILHPFFNYLTLNFFVLFSPLKPRFQSKQKSFSLHFSSLFLPLPFSPHPLYSPPPDHVFSASPSLLYTPPLLSLTPLLFSASPSLLYTPLLFSTPPFSSRPIFSSLHPHSLLGPPFLLNPPCFLLFHFLFSSCPSCKRSC